MPAPKFSNRARLNKKLKAIPTEVIKDASTALSDEAQETAGLMRRIIAKRSGRAAKSIRVEYAGSSGLTYSKGTRPKVTGVKVKMRIIAGSHEVFYIRWIEFGTRPHTNAGKFAGTHNPGAPAQPFFFPAYRARKKAIRSGVNRSMRKAARRVAKST